MKLKKLNNINWKCNFFLDLILRYTYDSFVLSQPFILNYILNYIDMYEFDQIHSNAISK